MLALLGAAVHLDAIDAHLEKRNVDAAVAETLALCKNHPLSANEPLLLAEAPPLAACVRAGANAEQTAQLVVAGCDPSARGLRGSALDMAAARCDSYAAAVQRALLGDSDTNGAEVAAPQPVPYVFACLRQCLCILCSHQFVLACGSADAVAAIDSIAHSDGWQWLVSSGSPNEPRCAADNDNRELLFAAADAPWAAKLRDEKDELVEDTSEDVSFGFLDDGVCSINIVEMRCKLNKKEWDVRRLGEPPHGVAVKWQWIRAAGPNRSWCNFAASESAALTKACATPTAPVAVTIQGKSVQVLPVTGALKGDGEQIGFVRWVALGESDTDDTSNLDEWSNYDSSLEGLRAAVAHASTQVTATTDAAQDREEKIAAVLRGAAAHRGNDNSAEDDGGDDEQGGNADLASTNAMVRKEAIEICDSVALEQFCSAKFDSCRPLLARLPKKLQRDIGKKGLTLTTVMDDVVVHGDCDRATFERLQGELRDAFASLRNGTGESAGAASEALSSDSSAPPSPASRNASVRGDQDTAHCVCAVRETQLLNASFLVREIQNVPGGAKVDIDRETSDAFYFKLTGTQSEVEMGASAFARVQDLTNTLKNALQVAHVIDFIDCFTLYSDFRLRSLGCSSHQ